MAGHGATGGLGEILLVDPATGQLKRTLIELAQGHRQVIVSLTFSPPGFVPALASADMQGRILYWKSNPATGLWAPHSDQQVRCTERYGAEVAARLRGKRGTLPVRFLDANHLIAPELVSKDASTPTWKLQQIDLTSGDRKSFSGGEDHRGYVTTIEVSPDGKRLVSADAFGKVFLWDVSSRRLLQEVQQSAKIVSLGFSPNGRWLLAGTVKSPLIENNPSLLQLWTVGDNGSLQKRSETRLPQDVHACRFSRDGKRIAYCQGNDVLLQNVTARPSETLRALSERLAAPVSPVRRVAFAKQKPFYRIAIGRTKKSFDEVFLTDSVQLSRQNKINTTDWMSSKWWSGNLWSLRVEGRVGSETFWLYHGKQRRGQIPLDPPRDGFPTATCWIPDKTGQSTAVAIGTNGTNNIYVYDLADNGICSLQRQFRGHISVVNSIGISKDARYLVSGSDDATVRIWTLKGFASATDVVNRWGVRLRVEGNRLIADEVLEEGPLHFRGLRTGDVITLLSWHDGTDEAWLNEPNKMLAKLTTSDWGDLVTFVFSRGNVEQPAFQMYPAWQQVASLFVSDNHQWAYWAPSGYYDTSFEGHKLFGWQLNHGVERLPEFFLAAQFRKALERPNVMKELLRAGSLEAAFRSARQIAPGASEKSIIAAYRLKPRIEILAPRDQQTISDGTATIEAAITVRQGTVLVPPKAYANGVVAESRELLQTEPVPNGQRLTYRWLARLPSDSRVKVQVLAATENESVATADVIVQQPLEEKPRSRRMFVLAAGVNKYADRRIQSLDHAVDNVRSLSSVLKRKTSPIYQSDVVTIIDRNLTRPMWKLVAEEYASRIRTSASPDDLLVIFLSGHGVKDEQTDDYYFISADADFADVKSGRYDDCLAIGDLSLFHDIPCRKLVILDTCHSGAVQGSLEQRHLKAALRSLQDDLFLTLTASEGNQEAIEERSRQMSRFTARLVEALNGAADRRTDSNGIVTLNEVIPFVQQSVAADSTNDTQRQFPTAGPIDLLPYIELPVTTVDQQR